MENIRVCIITEGSMSIGFGHITRMLSIYQAFEEKGIKSKFIVNGDEVVKYLFNNINSQFFNWMEDNDKLWNILKDVDIAIVDSYLAGMDFYTSISKNVMLSVYYDDNKRIEYPPGIVVNGNIYAKDLKYKKNKGIKYLIGAKYLPLRKEFWDVPNKSIKGNIESVMITFGGEDIRNMTPKVLKILKNNYPNLKKYVIIGKGFRNMEEINQIKDQNVCLVYYPDAKKIREIMIEADVAISAAGQTLYELARVGVPTISIIVADNQIKLLKGWIDKKFIDKEIYWNSTDLEAILMAEMEKYKDFHFRLNLQKIGKKNVSSNGSLNIVRNIIGEYIRRQLIFRKISEKDIWDIYEISNDILTRSNSLNPYNIGRNEHIKWFYDNLKNYFYVLDFKGKAIGQIRFHCENNKYLTSISIHKDFRGYGLGKILLSLGLKNLFSENRTIKHVYAMVKCDNNLSIKIFENLGFLKVHFYKNENLIEYVIRRADYETNKN